MKNNRNIILLIALLLVITFSTLLFFGMGSNEKSSIQICSFVFIIISEIITFGMALILMSTKTNTFLKAGFSSATVLYLVSAILINTIFLNLFATFKGILLTNFCLLIAYLFIDVIILFFKKEM